MPDPLFDDPRFARLYDPLDPDRSDLQAYLAIAAEFGAASVLDVGCGTGTFACLLAEHGYRVIGVDPAAASLDVARAKPHADEVRFLHGDATTLPQLDVDLAFMTGNVAQVFLTDESWRATLLGIRAALKQGGRLVFETRDPEREAWREWVEDVTYLDTEVEGVGRVRTWTDLIVDTLPLITFQNTLILPDGERLQSRSTLRFRTRDEIEESLAEAGYLIDEVRDAPDRPGREFVFVVRRA